MSKLTEELSAHGIINSHDFAYARGVLNKNYPLDRPAPRCRVYREHRIVPMIVYQPQQPGRGYKAACWQVSQGNVPTDPSGHWRDHGRMTFDIYRVRDQKQAMFEAAIAWASDYFGVSEWKREPFGTWMPAEFVDVRLKQLRDWIKTVRVALRDEGAASQPPL